VKQASTSLFVKDALGSGAKFADDGGVFTDLIAKLAVHPDDHSVCCFDVLDRRQKVGSKWAVVAI
jgi:hypothetical protein